MYPSKEESLPMGDADQLQMQLLNVKIKILSTFDP